MQIQVGKKYRTRSGDVASVIANYPGCSLPFVFSVEGDCYNQACKATGKYLNSEAPHLLDLVEEIQEGITFVVGKKYVQRNGDVVQCTNNECHEISSLPLVFKNITTSIGDVQRTSEGKYWTNGADSEYDVVKEYVEPAQTVQAIQPHPCKELIEEYARQYASGEKAAGWWQWYVSGFIAPISLTFVNGKPEDYRYEMTEKHPDFVPATLPVPVVAPKYNGDTKRLVIEFASEKEASQAVKYFDKLVEDSKK